jgi:hypothetical protein
MNNYDDTGRSASGYKESGIGAKKGRIAQVLAQARASLSEPSRPFTPLSMESRMTSIPSSMPLTAVSKKTTATKRGPKQIISEVYDLTSGKPS